MRKQGSSQRIAEPACRRYAVHERLSARRTLPEADPPPIVALLHQSLSRELASQIRRPSGWTRQLMKITSTFAFYCQRSDEVLTQKKRVMRPTPCFIIWINRHISYSADDFGIFYAIKFARYSVLRRSRRVRQDATRRSFARAELRKYAAHRLLLKCATAFSARSSSAPPCWLALATICALLTRLKLQLAMLPQATEIGI